MRAPLAMLAVALAGCAAWSPASREVARGDRLAADGDLDGALRAYDAALSNGAAGDIALRAHAGRAIVTAAQSTVTELMRVRQALVRVEEQLTTSESEVTRLSRELAAREADLETVTRELATRDGEVAKLTREVAARDAELARLRQELHARQQDLLARQQDLIARQAEIVRLGVEAEKLRGDLEDLKRLDIPLEKRRGPGGDPR